MDKMSFQRRIINVKLSQKEKSTGKKFHEQNQCAPSFTNKKKASNKFQEQNQCHEEKKSMYNFAKRKFNMQQIPRTKISTKQSMYKFHEEKKHNTQRISRTKSAHNTFHDQKISTQQVQ